MMRCKIHPSAAGAGVCATCLRERLTALSAAVSKAGDTDFSPESRRNLGRSGESTSFGLRPADPCRRKHAKKLSLLSFLSNHSMRRETNSDSEAAKPSRSRSWLSSVIRGQRMQKRKRRMPARISSRGMSPAEKEEPSEFESESGYNTDPLPARRQRRSNCRLKGFSLCFTPLMRPGAGNLKNQPVSEVGFSGELRGGGFGTQRKRCGGASVDGSSVLGPNRSRKIADFGKLW